MEGQTNLNLQHAAKARGYLQGILVIIVGEWLEWQLYCSLETPDKDDVDGKWQWRNP